MEKDKVKIVLASSSPRRKELLGHSFFPFDIEVSDIEEKSEYEKPSDIVVDLAAQKARVVFSRNTPSPVLVIGSDTIVALGSRILEKPKDIDEARYMLKLLSGQTHDVYTGVHFMTVDKESSFYTKTKVSFDVISPLLLERYLKTGDSLDKAGAYGIQGAALSFISNVEGSYSGVVGFPIHRVINELSKFFNKSYEELNEIFI